LTGCNYIQQSGRDKRLPDNPGVDTGAPHRYRRVHPAEWREACRHLVKDRMDITGARWGLQRAEAVLKLRSLKISGDLPVYLAVHFEQEHMRNYPGPPIPLAASEAP
jgi:hypothetical protein